MPTGLAGHVLGGAHAGDRLVLAAVGALRDELEAAQTVHAAEAAGQLQKAGLIHYSRGHITVLDRPKLEKQVCECYGVVKREMDRLLPDRTQT